MDELKWNGERYIPHISGEIELEHYHRYIMATELVKGKDVLDIACGEGYGAELLAQHASSVLGVDIAQEAIDYAQAKYQRPNLQFKQGSCSNIPLESASVDVIVSFETIEHHDQHEEMMLEFKRVLRPHGVLIISSPDKYFYTDLSCSLNPFHIKELYKHEFILLLQKHFIHVSSYGQKIIFGSAIFAQEKVSGVNYIEFDNKRVKRNNNISMPLYIIAVASDSPFVKLSSTVLDNDAIAIKEEKQAQSMTDYIMMILRGFKGILRLFYRLCFSKFKRYRLLAIIYAKKRYISMKIPYKTNIFLRKILVKVLPLTGQIMIDLPLSYSVPIHTIPKPNLIMRTPDASEIDIPIHNEPIVSVIIPVYGKFEFTIRCIYSIMMNMPAVAFELIVVDDHSPDNTLLQLKRMKGIIIIENAKNLGFIGSCNNGAKVARGKYVYFLNNDTQVCPGFMDHLVHTFDKFPGTGFVGSKLLNFDGSLQEAGGIICADAGVVRYGEDQHPMAPEFNFAREVDYCSGASIMIPKFLLEQLGGIDEIYAPGYYDDSDLALKVKEAGYKVLYQPLSEVIHYCGITFTERLISEDNIFKLGNKNKLYQRWQHILSSHPANIKHFDPDTYQITAKWALVLGAPLEGDEGESDKGLVRMIELRDQGYRLSFITGNLQYTDKYRILLQSYGIEVLYQPFVKSFKSHVKKFGARYSLILLIQHSDADNVHTIRKYCPKAKQEFLSLSKRTCFEALPTV